MTEKLRKEDEESETEAVEVEEREALKPTKPLSGVKREITEGELVNNSGAIRLLLGELDRLENEAGELSLLREKFHQVDKERAVLVERNKKINALELLFIVCLTVGAALIALNPHVDSNLFWAGVVLVIGSVISRVVQK